MPKEISFVQCDCKKGKLEEIASTKVSWGSACGDGGYETIFYTCDFILTFQVLQNLLKVP